MRKTIEALAREAARLNNRNWYDVSAAIALTGVPTCDGTAVAEPSAKLKDKLKRIKSDIVAAGEQRKSLQTAVDDAKAAAAGSDTIDPKSDEFKNAKTALGALGACDDKIAELREAERDVLEMIGGSPAARQDRPANDPRGDGWANVGEMLREEDAKALLDAYAHSAVPIGRTELGEVLSRDALAADITGTTAMRKGDFQGIVPQLTRPLRVLDLLPTGTMDNRSWPYAVESGAFSGAASQTEGAAKAEAGITFTDAEAFAQTIAAWMKLQKQSLEDASALQSVIETRLRYLVEYELERQVLSGSGTAPELRGIMNTSGIGAVTYDAAQLPADQVLSGLTTVLLANAQATGIVMNPLDWQAVLKAKAAGDGHYYSGGPFSITPQVMWGTPLVPSAAIVQGMVLVGAFDIGAQLLIRQGLKVLLSDADGSDFTTNKVTILAELRAALPVYRPAAFATVDIAA